MGIEPGNGTISMPPHQHFKNEVDIIHPRNTGGDETGALVQAMASETRRRSLMFDGRGDTTPRATRAAVGATGAGGLEADEEVAKAV